MTEAILLTLVILLCLCLLWMWFRFSFYEQIIAEKNKDIVYYKQKHREMVDSHNDFVKKLRELAK